MSDNRYRKGSVTLQNDVTVVAVYVRNWVTQHQPTPAEFWQFIASLGHAMEHKGDHLVQREIQAARGTIQPTFGGMHRCQHQVLKSGQNSLDWTQPL